MPPAERREQLLDAALELIGEQGYGGVSMEGIARRAGVTKPVVYDLFGNLGGILGELMEREEKLALKQLARSMPQPDVDSDPQQLLIEGTTAFLTAVTERPDAWRLILMPPEATPAVVRKNVDRNKARLAKQIEPLVAWGAKQIGGSLADLDTDLAARGLIVQVEHAARLALTDPKNYPPERFARFTKALIGAVFERGG